MTNEELDAARAEAALSHPLTSSVREVAAMAARLAREGWTPEAPDPDIEEARKTLTFVGWKRVGSEHDNMLGMKVALAGIKRGRELAAAEAKPAPAPVDPSPLRILIARALQGGCVLLPAEPEDDGEVRVKWRDAEFRVADPEGLFRVEEIRHAMPHLGTPLGLALYQRLLAARAKAL